MDNGAAVDLWRLVIRKLLFEKFRESKGVFGNIFCFDRFRKQVAHLVAEYRTATWLQNDDRRVGKHMRSKRGQVAAQIGLRHVKKTIVIEWPSATEVPVEDLDPAARLFQNVDRGLRSFRHEIVIEGIGP